jgi:hypothetical protein
MGKIVAQPAFQQGTHSRHTEGAAQNDFAIVLFGIADPRQGELPEIAQTDCTLNSFSSQVCHRYEDRHQEHYDSNHHQQLDERKSRAQTYPLLNNTSQNAKESSLTGRFAI